MTKRLFFFGLLLMAAAQAVGQALQTTSDTLRLDFGYPVLESKDDLTFIDQNENGQIDPGEGCTIVFTLENRSDYPAQNVRVRPREINALEGLLLPNTIEVGNLMAGGSRRIEVGVFAEDSLSSGTANFSFVVLEGEEVESATITYSIQVNQAIKPEEEAEEEDAAETDKQP